MKIYAKGEAGFDCKGSDGVRITLGDVALELTREQVWALYDAVEYSAQMERENATGRATPNFLK